LRVVPVIDVLRVGGDVWIEGATADPDDAQARAEAERIACA
jgi:hypothetical protein